MQIQNLNQIFRARGGTGAAVPPPALTGFVASPDAGHGGGGPTLADFSWNLPPVGATATEIWTSPDNITFSLAATVAAPGTSTSNPAPATGSIQWAKARWINSGAQGAFCAAQELSGYACDWSQRAFGNGGTTTLAQRQSVNTFALANLAAGIESSMLYTLVMVPGGTAATFLTPLYKVAGSDPAVNNGISGANFSINGIGGDATNYIDTGFLGTNFLSDTNFGISIYDSMVNTSNSPNYDVGYTDDTGSQSLLVSGCFNTTNYRAAGLSSASGQITGAQVGAGFFSYNRTASNVAKLYFANSGTAFAQLGATDGNAQTGTRQAVRIFLHALNHWNAGNVPFGQGNDRVSYLSFNAGWSAGQAQSEFNNVQAFRVAIGGGFV